MRESHLAISRGVGTGCGHLPHLGSSAKVSLLDTATLDWFHGQRTGKHAVCESCRLWRCRDIACDILMLTQLLVAYVFLFCFVFAIC